MLTNNACCEKKIIVFSVVMSNINSVHLQVQLLSFYTSFLIYSKFNL